MCAVSVPRALVSIELNVAVAISSYWVRSKSMSYKCICVRYMVSCDKTTMYKGFGSYSTLWRGSVDRTRARAAAPVRDDGPRPHAARRRRRSRGEVQTVRIQSGACARDVTAMRAIATMRTTRGVEIGQRCGGNRRRSRRASARVFWVGD